MGYWSGRTGPCWWSYFEGETTTEDWERFMGFSRESYTTAPPGDVILTVPYRSPGPTAVMRKQIGQMIEETRAVNRITHHAFSTDSKLIFAINTGINWISRKPFEERTFSDPMEALGWLASIRPAVDPWEVAREIRRGVPPRSLWPALQV